VFQDGSVGPISPASATWLLSPPPGTAPGFKTQAPAGAGLRYLPGPARQQTRGHGLGPTASLLAISSTFNPLFRVLFIFPSRYLFAIGLSLLFSFRWDLPPTWNCTRKQFDSTETRRTQAGRARTGLAPSMIPHSRGVLPAGPAGVAPLDYNSIDARGARPIFKLSSSLFTRRYWGNPC
jgi:hypothetical protein